MKNSNTNNENKASFGRTYVNRDLFYCIDSYGGLRLDDNEFSLKCEILDISNYENKEKAFEALEAKLRLLGLRLYRVKDTLFSDVWEAGRLFETPKDIEMRNSLKHILNKIIAIVAFDEATNTITYYSDEYIVGSQADCIFRTYCRNFMTDFDISTWTFDKNTTDINGIFKNLWNLKRIKLPNTDEPIYLMHVPTSKLKDTFSNCLELRELDLSCFRFVERGRENRSLEAFYRCEKIKKLNVSNFLPKDITYEELKEQKVKNELNSLKEITVDGKTYTF